jgi:hypothetical protein
MRRAVHTNLLRNLLPNLLLNLLPNLVANQVGDQIPFIVPRALINIRALCLLVIVGVLRIAGIGQSHETPIESVTRFPIRSDHHQLDRATHTGAFFDVVGRRSALFGYENRSLEAWVYPLKILDDFTLSFRLEGYPVEIAGNDIMASIRVRPDSTTLTYAHAAFTVRQIMFAPIDEQGIVILLEADAVLPLTITVSFRPRLRLMWPATSMTSSLGWDAAAHVYTLTEETGRYAGVIGCPYARDTSVMPYQEEPRDVPNRFVIEAGPEVLLSHRVPIVISASVDGRAAAKDAHDRILGSIQALYERTAKHYDELERNTIEVTTPDERLNTAFEWACLPAIARRARASVRDLRGSSAATRCGRRSQPMRKGILRRAARRWSSCGNTSGRMERSRTRFRNRRRSCRGSIAIRTRGPAPTPRRCT